LVFAAAAPMGAGAPWRAAALAFAGTLVVYNIDARGRVFLLYPENPERSATANVPDSDIHGARRQYFTLRFK